MNEYLDSEEHRQYKQIVSITKSFLSGFYGPFDLEVLSTIDYIITEKKTTSIEEKSQGNWQIGVIEKTMFTNPKFITLAVKNIEKHLA